MNSLTGPVSSVFQPNLLSFGIPLAKIKDISVSDYCAGEWIRHMGIRRSPGG